MNRAGHPLDNLTSFRATKLKPHGADGVARLRYVVEERHAHLVAVARGVRARGVAAAVLQVSAVISPHRRACLSAWRFSSAWKVMVPATLLGSYTALTLWIAGMTYTLASVAGIPEPGPSSTL